MYTYQDLPSQQCVMCVGKKTKKAGRYTCPHPVLPSLGIATLGGVLLLRLV